MTAYPLIPQDRLPPIDGELLRRINQLDAPPVIDVTAGPIGHALAWALMFERWPDLIDVNGPLDRLQQFYNRYFWFRRFAVLWQAEYGPDAGIEERVVDILGQAEEDVDWDLVEQLRKRAGKDTEPNTHQSP